MILSASDGACNSQTYGLSNSKLTSSFDLINKHIKSYLILSPDSELSAD
jgi:hypothetical protein